MKLVFAAMISCLPAQCMADDAVDYVTQIKPLLAAKCYPCHGALRQESGLRLETRELILAGGESGAVLTLDDPDASSILYRVTADIDERMPPKGEGSALTAEEVSRLREWIRQGAVAPVEAIPAAPEQHWAFLAPVRAAVPDVSDPDWATNPVDRFLAAQHQARGLVPLPVASRELLLRRLYVDLVGMPPSRDQIQAFLADESDGAWSQVVDELLNSPHYGERWGRHWMDVWRYSDWYGLGAQVRNSQKHIWHWRDWIVESLNDDQGYDRMVVEMLAADEIAPTDERALRATGFLARQYYLFNRTTWLDDTIEHTSKAFLGLTVNCAKCHSHKYDPITHEDYYRMRAIFEPYQVRLETVPGQTDLEQDGIPRVFDAHPDAETFLHIRGDEKNPDTTRPMPPDVPHVLAFDEFRVVPVSLPARAWQPEIRDFVLADQLAEARQEVAAAAERVAAASQQLDVLRSVEAVPIVENSAAPFLADDFAEARAELWTTGEGEHQYSGGTLRQTADGSTRAWIRSKHDHPRDFELTLRFRTLGGKQWRSVGVGFDVADDREKFVYLSAVMPGSKLQVSYRQDGTHVYPVTGQQARTVPLNEWIELTFAVKGNLINVAVDGVHALAYEFPVEREDGRVDVVAFDATAEFDLIQILPLASDRELLPAATGRPDMAAKSVAEGELAVQKAEAGLVAAKARIEALRTSYSADLARSREESSDDVAKLVRDAALAARRFELAKAQEMLLAAQAAATASGADPLTDKDVAAAKVTLEKARQAVEQPGENYTSIRASLKSKEGPDETDEDQRQPYPRESTGRRSAFAAWLTDRRNPLTARVAVNHIWMRHFGQPLVESVTDFGLRSAEPPQRELLDWLAVELMENDWSMKHLHRLIVTSRAWQLSSSSLNADPETVLADPQNQFYWRRRPVRMESQVIRDSLLSLAGVLDRSLGGPSLDAAEKENVYRRSLYFRHSRDDQNAFLTMFDDADILRCYRRSDSVVPQQALAMANSRLALAMSRHVAERITASVPDASDEEFIREAFTLILAIPPNEQEMQVCLDAMDATRQSLASAAAETSARRSRENLVHALLNHNDFITIR